MRILRRQISTFVVSIVLSLLGVAALLFTFWRILPHISSVKDLLSTFMALLWTEKFDLIPNFEFELIYIVVLGDVLLISGVILYVLSVQWFLLPGKVVWYQCPFCHKDWRSTGDKALIHCRIVVSSFIQRQLKKRKNKEDQYSKKTSDLSLSAYFLTL